MGKAASREAAREHVLWDFRVFRAAVEARLNPAKWSQLQHGDCICVDSLLLHARTLYHFFTNHKSRPDDIIASELLPEVGGAPWQATFGCLNRTDVDDISKFRGHLTSSRDQPERVDWSDDDVGAISHDIEAAWGGFVACIPEAERGRWWV